MVKIFIGWSGKKSKGVARALREWIPTIIQSAKPWMSEIDLDPGARWNQDIQDEVENAKLGVLCLTPDNLSSTWMHFEAGMLANSLKDRNYVCPYLLGIEPSDIQGPLSQFQAKRAEKDGTKELLYLINKIADNSIDESRIDQLFGLLWVGLESKLNGILLGPSDDVVPPRDSTDILRELLELTRQQSRMISDITVYKKDERLKLKADIIIKALKEGVFEDNYMASITGYNSEKSEMKPTSRR
ncbi:MAG: toll/interleukin-1 receptor domain-containing protein [Methanotrichaceae archaeon]|nr:toll/interleukin-1 receptor domain-containing protein [Methanotrichaceae archaeon]